MTLSLAACGQTASSPNASTNAPGASALSETTSAPNAESIGGTAQGRVLVAYFSWSGNTEEMASYIAEQTGGDLLEIKTVHPYTGSYNAIVEQGHR